MLYRKATKRLLDITISGTALIIGLPFLLLAVVAISLFSPGPVFYRGQRVGMNGRNFRVFKLRSMVVDAEQKGGSATADDDPRLTRVGAVLRKYKIDELPQLMNVLLGDMSLVGPRPEVSKYVDMYSAEERAILKVRPGITDWASLWNFDEGAVLAGSIDPERDYELLIRPTKLRLQLEYVRTWSLTTDLEILFHTAMKLLFRDRWVPGPIRLYTATYGVGRKPGYDESSRLILVSSAPDKVRSASGKTSSMPAGERHKKNATGQS